MYQDIYNFICQNTQKNKIHCPLCQTYSPTVVEKMRKSRGPSTVPCVTQDITGASLEVNLTTTTLCFLLERNDSTQPMTSLLRLYCLCFCSRRWWGTLSKAFAKLSNSSSACECRFRIDARSWAVMISWNSQERRHLKPCWMSTGMLWLSRCFIGCERMMCYGILQQMEVSETGQ